MLTLFLLIVPFGHVGADEDTDLLVYKLNNFDGKPSLILYDPATGEKTSLLTDVDFGGFSLSTDGRLAYSLVENDQRDLYIQDIYMLDQEPVNISNTQDANEDVLSWSPDGRYLAFVLTGKDNIERLYVWDSTASTAFVDITPQDMTDVPEWYDPAWSSDGRLAFTVWYGFTGKYEQSEIYLWDGQATTNLSQNPTDRDEQPAWSDDGRVAFLSAYTEGYDIFVWDGVSFKDDVPNRDTYINIAPKLTAYYSFPAWSPQGQVAFNSQTAHDTHTQIYVWEGATATNISQNPNLHNGIPVWSHDGKMAFVTFFSQAQLLYVHDEHGRILLTTEGQYPPAWSSNGYLIFCRYGWKLMMWDGDEIREIAQSGEISAKWQSGSSVFCSSG
ncbi:MAG: hypothetical protein ABI690_10335 [Chloroflexota bacterium]